MPKQWIRFQYGDIICTPPPERRLTALSVSEYANPRGKGQETSLKSLLPTRFPWCTVNFPFPYTFVCTSVQAGSRNAMPVEDMVALRRPR